MTQIEASALLSKYNYLVGKTLGNDTISAIMPVPIDAGISVEEAFTTVFNNIPHNLFDYTDYRVAVMFNYQEFQDNGVVNWKYLDEVLKMLEIQEV